MTKKMLIDRRAGLTPAEPLWQRVPTRDENGAPLHDFMMLIPGLRHWSETRRQGLLQELQEVLRGFGDEVLFADLNLQLNLLWVSVRPERRLCLPLARAVQACCPEARLVASQAEALVGASRPPRRRRFGLLRLGGG